MIETTITVDKDSLPQLAHDLLRIACDIQQDKAVVVALHGDLGAGKTTFVQTLAHTLGVTEHVTSPTFTIMKGYETTNDTFSQLIHMDAYRIDDESELIPLRFNEILAAPRTLFCIEWAEKIAGALPPSIITLSLTVVDENTRTAHLSYS